MEENTLFTRRYMIRRWLVSHVSLQEVLGVCSGIAGAVLSGLSVPNPWGWRLSAAFSVLSVAQLVLLAREKYNVDVQYRRMIESYFHAANEEFFDGRATFRWTLFRIDSLNTNYVVPHVRYRKGQKDAIKEVQRSRAHYRNGEGLVGHAWAESKSDELYFAQYPDFNSRKQMEEYYISEGIDPATVSKLSDFMVGVKWLFCYPFFDKWGNLEGILAVDSTLDWVTSEPYLNRDHLAGICGSIDLLLQAQNRGTNR